MPYPERGRMAMKPEINAEIKHLAEAYVNEIAVERVEPLTLEQRKIAVERIEVASRKLVQAGGRADQLAPPHVCCPWTGS